MTTIRARLISGSAETGDWLTTCLEAWPNVNEPSIVIVDHPEQLPDKAEEGVIIFLDLCRTEAQGDLLLAALKSANGTPLIALVNDDDQGCDALAQGAADYLIPGETAKATFLRATRYALQQPGPRHVHSATDNAARFQRYLEKAPDVFFVFDLQRQCITYLNRPALFGLDRQQLSQPDVFLQLIHPSDQSVVIQHWKQAAHAADGDLFTSEFRLRNEAGDWEWVQSRETILHDGSDGEETFILVSLSVITNRREREAAVRRYAERLQILHEIDQAIVAARSPQTIAQSTLRHINRLVSSYRASVVIFNWESSSLSIIAELPEGGAGRNDSTSLPLDWFWGLDSLEQGELYRLDDISGPEFATADENGNPPAAELLSWWRSQGVQSLVSVPLQAQRKLLGALNFGGDTPHSFTPEDLVVMREVAHVLAIGIGQAKLYEQAHHHARKLEQRARRLLLVNDISLAVNRPVELDAVLKAAARGLVQVIDLRQVGIVLLNKKRDTWTHLVSHSARHGAASRELNITISNKEHLQRTLQSNGLFVIDDVKQQLRLTGLEDLLLEQQSDRLMIIPLQVRNEVIGLIGCDIAPGTRPFSREETDLVRTVANLLAVKIEHLRLLEAERKARSEAEAHAAMLRQRERHLTLLNSVTRATTGLQMEEMMQTVVERLGEASGADACYLTLWDETQQRARPAAAYGSNRETYTSYQVQPGETTLTATVLEAGRPVQTTGNDDDDILSPRIASDFGPAVALAIPLITGQERLGALIISYADPYTFLDTEIALYEQAAGQIALALSAARLFEETRRQLEELRVLHSLATAGAEARSEDALLERATQLMKQSLFPHNFGVLLYDEEAQILYRHHTYVSGQHERTEIHIPVGHGICGYVAQTGEAVRSGNVDEDPRYVSADPQTRSELCVPLKTGEHLIGVVNVESRDLNAYTEVHERLLSTFAHQLATAIEKLRLFSHTQINLAETQALYQVSRSLIAAKDLPDLLQAVVNSVSQALPADRTLLITVDLQRRQLIDYVLDERGDLDIPRMTFDELWHGLPGWVLREQRPLLSPKGQRDQRESDVMQEWREETGAGSSIVVPLRYRDKILGTITAVNRNESPDFTQRNVDLMAAMANQAAVAIENTRLFAETRRRAEELEVLSNLSAALRVADGAGEVMQSLVSAAAELFTAEIVAVFVPGEEPDSLTLANSLGIPGLYQTHEYQVEETIAGYVFSSGTAYLSRDIMADQHAFGAASGLWPEQSDRVQSAIFAPLSAGSQIVGIVSVMNRPEYPLGEEELGLLVAMAEITGSALHRAGLMETLEQRVIERTRELADANERLQELDRLKSKFVSDVSHELRTPITSISLYLDLIERGSPERSERYWTVLRKQTERLNQLIEDILSLSRLQMGRVDVSLTPTDLVEIVEDVIDVRRNDFENAGLALHFSGGDEAPLVLAQPDLLGQVVDNLLSNALNYTTEGAVHVRIYLDKAQRRTCIAIEDSGVGIDSDDLPHIFERFYRGQYAGQSNIPGTGLGLTIVDEIISLHHGVIEVESETEKGTTFRVWLPYFDES